MVQRTRSLIRDGAARRALPGAATAAFPASSPELGMLALNCKAFRAAMRLDRSWPAFCLEFKRGVMCATPRRSFFIFSSESGLTRWCSHQRVFFRPPPAQSLPEAGTGPAGLVNRSVLAGELASLALVWCENDQGRLVRPSVFASLSPVRDSSDAQILRRLEVVRRRSATNCFAGGLSGATRFFLLAARRGGAAGLCDKLTALGPGPGAVVPA